MAGLAVFVTISAVRPTPVATTEVVVAAVDLGPGHVIKEADLGRARWPSASVDGLPIASEVQLVGRATTGPITAAEPITTTRVVGPQLLDQVNATASAHAELVAAPVRLADPAQAQLLTAGDVIDVLAARPADGGGQKASTIAVDVPVLSVPARNRDSGSTDFLSGPSASLGNGSGTLIVVAVDRATAIDLAAAATRSQLSVVLKPR